MGFLWSIWTGALDWWRANKNAPVALQKMLFVAGMAAAIAFFAGRQQPEGSHHKLQSETEELRGDLRKLAAARETGEGEIRRLRLKAEIADKTEELLARRLKKLAEENMRAREEVIFYRRLLGAESQTELNVYAMEETPDFRPGHHRFSAVLVFPQTEFTGSYYFEAVAAGGEGGGQVVRAPPEDNAPLKFTAYEEIEQVAALPPGAQIEKLRLVVHDKEGRVEAEAVIEADPREKDDG